MIKYIILITILLLSGCSFKTPPNKAQLDATNSFSSYTKNFLSGEDALARSDIKRAISHSKKSSDLTSLARVYLGESALHVAVGLDDDCSKYLDIKELIDAPELDAYYKFITNSLSLSDIEYLNKSHKEFAKLLLVKNFKEAFKEALDEDKRATTKLLQLSLIANHLTTKEIDKILSIASYNGYKKSLIYWLKIKKSISSDDEEIDKIIKKLLILES